MIIFYYADSLGMARPGEVTLEQRYIYQFQKWLQLKHPNEEIFIIDRAKGRSVISSLYKIYKHDQDYMPGKKNILIIHDGIVDCFPRPIPLAVRNLISMMPGFLQSRIVRWIQHNRSGLLKSGFRFFLTDKKEFERIFYEWLKDASEWFTTIIVINIAPVTEKLEVHSPGAKESVIAYNQIIKNVINNIGKKNIFLADVYQLIMDTPNDIHELISDDGHHITALAHKMYTKEIIRLQEQIVIE